MTNFRREFGGVGVEEADGGGAAGGGERTGLVDEFGGEVEGGQVFVASIPKAEGRAAGAATGFEQWRREVGKIPSDENTLGRPQAHEVGRAGVMDDRDRIVEIGADGGWRYFFRCHVAMNMPLALSSWGQRKRAGWVDLSAASGSGSSSGCRAVKAAATAVVSLRVRVQTE